MARTPLYSRPVRSSVPAAETPPVVLAGAARAQAVPLPPPRPRGGERGAVDQPAGPSARSLPLPTTALPSPTEATARPARPPARWRALLVRPGWALLAPALLLAVVASWVAWPGWHGGKAAPPALGIEQIDAALRESFARQPLRSAAALAYEAIIPSVVRVVAEHDARPEPAAAASQAGKPGKAGKSGSGERGEHAERDGDDGRSVGTGVVIVDKGVILTNMHVIAGASRIRLTFRDGSESLATVMNLMPEHDLAVLQARTIPDDLHAATMRSTADLQPGDEVLAVGFPFGIGPSASTGVVSGLKREFRSGEGRRTLSNLIQFDAAANPGNSGGPLVTMDGHVVGIVTAIMNPNAQRTFIGIGFAVPIENAAAGAGLAPF
ncbi:MAG: hypothetical protein RLZZ584_858 [Pseudomonadota bacterium]